MVRIAITAQGEYDAVVFPETLAAALAAEIESHMKAYGVTKVEVGVRVGRRPSKRAKKKG